ncbi:hypothetical protein HW555_006301 [Spodoptera exigua]|uniref:Uncharacterized protein n=1 Tax=Spodoptera exigua TaxID=7107 RepID=A0A835LA81_SPOEX|nr:hypothetical protein HW555_006301 [Spodoptera exigua]
MLRVSLVVCVVPAVFGIIVRDPPPSPNDYKYSYNVEDPATGDSKSQHEDLTERSVRFEYTADAKHGFKAVLREDPVSPPLVRAIPVQHSYHAANDIQYQPPSPPGPVFASVLHPQPYSNYVEEKPAVVYFSPHSEIEHKSPFNGNYFVPANNKY